MYRFRKPNWTTEPCRSRYGATNSGQCSAVAAVAPARQCRHAFSFGVMRARTERGSNFRWHLNIR